MSEIIKKVRKRDGSIVDFDQEQITNAIFKAAIEVGGGRNRRIVERLSDEVVRVLEEKYAGTIPGVKDIQDVIETVLIEHGHARTAKAFILYRTRESQMLSLGADKPKVFVVYGHNRDTLSKLELTLRQIGAEPLIFNQLPTSGSQTIIEILEENIPKADAIVVLLTPDDEGRKRNSDAKLEPRARQNTLIEAGYAVISQRKKSILISLGGVKIPTDFDGIYKVEDLQWSDTVAFHVAKRLQNMGLKVDPTKAIR